MKTLILGLVFAAATFAQGSMVQGGTPVGVTATDSPVLMGGVDNNGTKQAIPTGTQAIATVIGQTSMTGISTTGFGSFSAWSGAAVRPGVLPWFYNGVSLDAGYTCNSNAVVNVTNGTTGQIVALAASKTIRVCSLVLTSTATTTATLSYGTGTLCATGNTALSGAMALAAASPLSIHLGSDAAIRTASANAFCLAAGATTVTGFISYSQY